jgi:hypothetical protein
VRDPLGSLELTEEDFAWATLAPHGGGGYSRARAALFRCWKAAMTCKDWQGSVGVHLHALMHGVTLEAATDSIDDEEDDDMSTPDDADIAALTFRKGTRGARRDRGAAGRWQVLISKSRSSIYERGEALRKHCESRSCARPRPGSRRSRSIPRATRPAANRWTPSERTDGWTKRLRDARTGAEPGARGRDAVLRGIVRVNGVPARKPAQSVCCLVMCLRLSDDSARYVSRAALKLRRSLSIVFPLIPKENPVSIWGPPRAVSRRSCWRRGRPM